MSQRKPTAKSVSEKMEEGKKAQLKQYNDDSGHFSLVRWVPPSLLPWLPVPFPLAHPYTPPPSLSAPPSYPSY